MTEGDPEYVWQGKRKILHGRGSTSKAKDPLISVLAGEQAAAVDGFLPEVGGERHP